MSDQVYGSSLIPPTAKAVLASFTSAASSTAVAVGIARANIRVCVTTQALWILEGTSASITASAGGTNCRLCPVGITDFTTAVGTTHIAYIEDAGSARGSIERF